MIGFPKKWKIWGRLRGSLLRYYKKLLFLNTPLRKSSEEVIKGERTVVEQPKKYKRQTSVKSAKTNRKDRREEKYLRLFQS